MFRGLEVIRYRGFEQLVVPKLTPVTLVSGRNNVGKTALLEALALAAAGPQSGPFALAGIRTSRLDPYPGPTPQLDVNPFVSLCHDHEPRGVVGFHAVTRDHRLMTTNWSIVPTEPGPSRGGAVFSAQGTPTTSYTHHLAISCDAHDGARDYWLNITVQAFIPASVAAQGSGPVAVGASSVQWELEPHAPAAHPFYFLSGRTRSSHAEIAARFSAQRTARRAEIYEEVLRDVDARVRGVSSEIHDGQLVLHVDVGGPYLTPLPELGEGMTAIADFVGCILSIEGGIVLVDEIENGIHHTALESLWRAVAKASRLSGTQVVASTHSRECVDAASRVFTDDEKTFSLLRLSAEGTGSGPSVKTYTPATLDGALDMELDVR